MFLESAVPGEVYSELAAWALLDDNGYSAFFLFLFVGLLDVIDVLNRLVIRIVAVFVHFLNLIPGLIARAKVRLVEKGEETPTHPSTADVCCVLGGGPFSFSLSQGPQQSPLWTGTDGDSN